MQENIKEYLEDLEKQCEKEIKKQEHKEALRAFLEAGNAEQAKEIFSKMLSTQHTDIPHIT